MQKQHCVGVDLGTTYSTLSVINAAGESEIVANADGDKLTASAVFHDPSGIFMVGTDALAQRGGAPDRVAAEFKREMDKPDWRADLGSGHQFSAIELSAMVLRKLKKDAEQVLGELPSAVITVPAYFDDLRRRATIEAGKAAGFEVLQLLNEPTAAALAFARGGGKPGTYLIFDLGGGTFDVSIIRINSETNMQVLATTGNPRLGGMDFDWALLLFVNDAFKRRTGRDALPGIESVSPERRRRRAEVLGLEAGSKPLVDRAYAFTLLRDIERHKRMLSKAPKVTIEAGFGAAKVGIDVTVQEFESVIADHVSNARLLVENALEDARLSAQDVDQVILVGGSTRIPAFGAMLSQLFGKAPMAPVHQDEAVARGAAIQAGILLAQQDESNLNGPVAGVFARTVVRDVCSHAFGTLALCGEAGKLQNDILIPKNTPIPASVMKRYFTVSPNQQSVDCTVTEVADDSIVEPEWITTRHEASLELPAGRAAGCPIDVTYSYDSNQVMRCMFVDVQSGKSMDLVIDVRNGKAGTSFDGDGLDDLRII